MGAACYRLLLLCSLAWSAKAEVLDSLFRGPACWLGDRDLKARMKPLEATDTQVDPARDIGFTRLGAPVLP